MAMEMAMATLIGKFFSVKKNCTETKAWTENKRGRRTSVDGEQAWSFQFQQFPSLHDRRGLESSVDLNKAWT